MTDMVIPPVLAAEVEPWLQECGSCDYALEMGCTCPQGDYRNILLKVWRAYEAQAADTKALVETATRLGRELGRREAAEEIAQAIEAYRAEVSSFPITRIADLPTPGGALIKAAQLARETATKEPK